MNDIKIITRQVKKEDKDFILSSWLRGQYWGNQYWRQMPQDLFFSTYAQYIMKLLSNPKLNIEVAITEDDPSLILGFLVYTNETVFWAYVKKDYRSKGILNLLMKDKQIKYSCASTRPGDAIAKKKNLIFNPFLTE